MPKTTVLIYPGYGSEAWAAISQRLLWLSSFLMKFSVKSQGGGDFVPRASSGQQEELHMESRDIQAMDPS